MSKIVHAGPFKYRVRSWQSLIRISIGVWLRRLVGRSLVDSWSVSFEIGTIFWREQFNRAFSTSKIAEGRVYFDSLQTFTDEKFDVRRERIDECRVKGEWITPVTVKDDITILYLHGGGYTFNSGISQRFADGLASLLRRRVFSLIYRPTPEYCHPTQIDDGLASYRYLLDQGVDPSRLVILGDSAGGHLVLMSLLGLRDTGLSQPALAIGLCPWTDLGDRGASFYDNDQFDLVQSYMALKFGEWLMTGSGCSLEELSPMYLDFQGCAPIYLQAGSHEILHDMIRDFTDKLVLANHEITLDVWPDMVHNFQAHGETHPASAQAFLRIDQAIGYYARDKTGANEFEPTSVTACRNKII